mgnify:CR=1 FL=1
MGVRPLFSLWCRWRFSRPVSAPNYARSRLRFVSTWASASLGPPTVCSLDTCRTAVFGPCGGAVRPQHAAGGQHGADLRLGYGFPGVPQVQSGSRADEPQVSELPLCRGHIRSLTKTAANRKSARRRRGAGGPPRALLRRIPTFCGLPVPHFVQFLLNNTGGDDCPSGCEVSPRPRTHPLRRATSKNLMY